jgi:DnaJ-class molecular chaperone
MGENLYEVLGVAQNAGKEEIKASYRKLVRKFHPDINQAPGAVERFKKITLAFKTLTDDIERLKYDNALGYVGHAGRKKAEKPKRPEAQGSSSGQEFFEEKPKKAGKKAEDAKPFQKIFQEFFEEKKQEKKQAQNADVTEKLDGENIYTNIIISSSEALKGAARKINIVHCEPCSKCEGRKFINGAKCALCEGSGEKTIHKKLSIKIPPNVKDGMKIRVANEGKAGKNGGKNGDLYLSVTVAKEQSIFETHENETLCTIPITPWEAALGANIQVPTPHGSVLMKIPPKTASGQRFKLVDNGTLNSKTGKNNDLIVIVNVEVPKDLNAEELELYEKLKKLDERNIRKDLLERHGVN